MIFHITGKTLGAKEPLIIHHSGKRSDLDKKYVFTKVFHIVAVGRNINIL